MNDGQPRFRLVASALPAAIWLALVFALMIADVWDETNGMLFFSSGELSLASKLKFAATESLGFWRPLPALMVAAILHALRDFEVSWRLLRGLNALFLLASLWLFIVALRKWRAPSARGELAFTVAMLFSGSAFITAGWYANVFDASALLLIAAGTALLAHSRPAVAGVTFGVAFFCKETAVLSLPFLFILLAGRFVNLRAFLRATFPAVVLGGVYFILRSRIVELGSADDIHQFEPELFAPSALHFAQNFWFQTLKNARPAWIGLAAVILSIAVMRVRIAAAATAFLATASVIYWGMFWEYQDGRLIHHLNFTGRLFLIPAVLLLVVLMLEKRETIIAILCIPIMAGAFFTWRDHLLFQKTYREIYTRAAASNDAPLKVHYPPKPLNDTVRGIVIGDMPDAEIEIDPRSGDLR
jgi:hypothetical protein